MAEELGHEALAEAHHLAVAAALAGSVGGDLGIEVGTALGAAHGQSGERVLEYLLKAEELEHREIHSGVEAETALVGADRGVELNAVAAVHAHGASVVDPVHAEHDSPLRLNDALENRVLLVLRMRVHNGGERGEDLFGGLDELRLVGVLGLEVF